MSESRMIQLAFECLRRHKSEHATVMTPWLLVFVGGESQIDASTATHSWLVHDPTTSKRLHLRGCHFHI
jgi:hypothetical protein